MARVPHGGGATLHPLGKQHAMQRKAHYYVSALAGTQQAVTQRTKATNQRAEVQDCGRGPRVCVAPSQRPLCIGRPGACAPRACAADRLGQRVQRRWGAGAGTTSGFTPLGQSWRTT